MGYKILYIEDLEADSIVDNLTKGDFDVTVNDASTFESVLNNVNQDFDAYLMDYRLDGGTGRVDAPTYASTIRSHGANCKQKPIILISSEDNLKEFEKDFTNQDLFDFVVTKDLFRTDKDKYIPRIKALIEAYKLIETSKFNICTVLNEDSSILDYRLEDKLKKFAEARDTYAFCRTIYYSLIRACGALIGDDILAARLGVDSECKDFDLLKDKFNDCKYSGIISSSYSRWWFHKVMNEWERISEGKSLRRLNASERVLILNESYGLNLVAATPMEHSFSSNFWTVCVAMQKPLDPSEGYVISRKDIDFWQEQEYISLKGALEYSENLNFMSPIDKSEISNFKG